MKRHNSLEQYIFLTVALIVFAYAAYLALDFPTQAQTFPRSVALAAILMIVIEMIAYFFSIRGDKTPAPDDSIRATIGGIFPYLLWLGAYYIVIYFIGMVAASGLFIFFFLLLPGQMKWYSALFSAVLIIAFLILMEDVMNLRWPSSLFDPIEMLGLH